MNRPLKTYDVTIFGTECSFVSDEAPETVLSAAQYVDTLMQHIAKGAQRMEPKKIALLAAVRLAHELNLYEQERAKAAKEQQSMVERINAAIVT